jgi:hypothetical protein
MTYTTGNDIRDALLMAAIAKAQQDGVPITVPVLELECGLPADFELGQDELDGMLASMAPAEAESTPIEPDAVDAPEESSPAAMTATEARDRVVALNNQLAQARADVMSAQQRQRDARAKLGAAITQFQSGFAKISPSELLRQNARDQAELRRLGKDGRMRQSQPGPSAVDQMAYFSKGGSVNRGAGPKWRRGAYDASAQGAPNSDPRRGPVAKPPGQQ